MARGEGGVPRFWKISQKFASVNGDLPNKNVPLLRKSSLSGPTGMSASESEEHVELFLHLSRSTTARASIDIALCDGVHLITRRLNGLSDLHLENDILSHVLSTFSLRPSRFPSV